MEVEGTLHFKVNIIVTDNTLVRGSDVIVYQHVRFGDIKAI